jgi:predicted peroxiredoxin
MRNKPERALGLLLCCALLLALPGLAAAAGPQEPMDNLVMILSSDDPSTAGATIHMAQLAAQRGHKVSILLRVKAIILALKDSGCAVDGVTMQKRLAKVMQAGVRVLAGGGCMKQQGIAPQKLISGVEVGTPDSVMGMIFEANTRIISQ